MTNSNPQMFSVYWTVKLTKLTNDNGINFSLKTVALNIFSSSLNITIIYNIYGRHFVIIEALCPKICYGVNVVASVR